MRTRIEWNWEKLDESTTRAMVYGGWLISKNHIIHKGKETFVNGTLTFLPDRDHAWSIMPPIVETEKKPSLSNDF